MAAQPVFVFSLPRSGSTLFQRMLSCHTDIKTESELWFLLPHLDTVKGKFSRSLYSNNTLKEAMNSLTRQLPEQTDTYFESLKLFTDNIYQSIGGEKKYVVDKTPRYYFIINEIKKLYPNGKFIFLFRNPCSVSASLVESFYKDRLGDYTHKIDFFEGPKLLAEGYRNLKGNCIAIKYEELVCEPERELRKVCDYLDIEFQDSMIKDFNSVPLKGLGDQFGTKKFNSVQSKSVDKWKKVFNTRYRKNYLKKVVKYIGAKDLKDSGYDFDSIMTEINDIDTKFSLSIEDRLRELKSTIFSLFDVPIILGKLKQKKSKKGKHYIYH